GIRDKLVTGVQTCALPILGQGAVGTSSRSAVSPRQGLYCGLFPGREAAEQLLGLGATEIGVCDAGVGLSFFSFPCCRCCLRGGRSEERRVGIEGRLRVARE